MHQKKNPQLDPKTVPEEEHPSGDPMPSKQRPYPVQWEYHVMRIQDTVPRLPSDQLDDLGREGWEMVSIFHLHATINFVFKRFALQTVAPMPPAGAKMMEELEKE